MIKMKKFVFGEIMSLPNFREASLAIRGYVPYKYSQEEIIDTENFWIKSSMKFMTAYLDDDQDAIYKIIIKMYTELNKNGFSVKHRELYNAISKAIGISNFNNFYNDGNNVVDLLDDVIKTMICNGGN